MSKVSFARKFVNFCNENVVLIAGGIIIVSTHWTWSMLQQTRLVPEEKRKDLPVFIGARYLEQKVSEEIQSLRGSAPLEDKEKSAS